MKKEIENLQKIISELEEENQELKKNVSSLRYTTKIFADANKRMSREQKKLYHSMYLAKYFINKTKETLEDYIESGCSQSINKKHFEDKIYVKGEIYAYTNILQMIEQYEYEDDYEEEYENE